VSEHRTLVYGPENSRCDVLVFREGLLAVAAHDLLLSVGVFEIALDPGALSVAARLDAGSLRVVTALRDGRKLPGALSPADVRKIEETVAREILRASRFPEIRFTSSEIVAAPGGGWTVRGALTMVGATRPLSFDVRRGGGQLASEAIVHQPDFGIRPYSAMLGALRVKPDVLVRASVPEPLGQLGSGTTT
jgi:polyisoprenoid-binding protein YceI